MERGDVTFAGGRRLLLLFDYTIFRLGKASKIGGIGRSIFDSLSCVFPVVG